VARPRKDTAPAVHSQTLDRGIRLLVAVASSGAPLELSQLAEHLDVHRSIAYRLVRTLEAHGLVHLLADGRYEPGLGLAALGAGVRRPLQSAAGPELARLAQQAGATAFLAVRQGDDVVTVASVEPPNVAAHVAYRPGTRHPIDRGAPGLAILAGEPKRAGERPEVARARRVGYASSRGEVLPGLSSVAAPIVRGTGDVAGAVALVFLHESQDLSAIGALVIAAATAVAAALG
jgi:DNA-binding IclR family transcriptional regulator